jgi:predicted nucleic acid-binding Zn ribbon protein
MTSSEKKNNPGNPVAMNQLLAAFFDNKKWRNRLELHAVFEFWDATVGEEIADIAQPSLIRGSVLWLKVADSVWMQQLHMQKTLLLEKINQQLPGAKLSDIHLQLDSTLAKTRKRTEEKPHKLKLVPDKKKEQEFDHLIGSLENDEIKASLKSLWLKLHERRRLKTED